jgi:DNA helicase-2/ATP-dependent DNA helicase PcrA
VPNPSTSFRLSSIAPRRSSRLNHAAICHPLQLAIYRLAWAEITGTPLEAVRASFYYVRTGELVTPGGLPGRAGLERLLDL